MIARDVPPRVRVRSCFCARPSCVQHPTQADALSCESHSVVVVTRDCRNALGTGRSRRYHTNLREQKTRPDYRAGFGRPVLCLGCRHLARALKSNVLNVSDLPPTCPSAIAAASLLNKGDTVTTPGLEAP